MIFYTNLAPICIPIFVLISLTERVSGGNAAFGLKTMLGEIEK
jgi:hypothetical protein